MRSSALSTPTTHSPQMSSTHPKYPLDIGEYSQKSPLPIVEYVAYFQIIEHFSSDRTQKPLPLDFCQAALLLGMEEDQEAVGNVLKRFCHKLPNGYVPKRITNGNGGSCISGINGISGLEIGVLL